MFRRCPSDKELCQLFDTLIADAYHLYDRNLLGDQLILGSKGTLSCGRAQGAQATTAPRDRGKCERGELVRGLTPGNVCDPAGKVDKDPKLRVQEAIELVFRKFREMGSIRQTYRRFHEETIEVPVNKLTGGRFHLVWKRGTSLPRGSASLHPGE